MPSARACAQGRIDLRIRQDENGNSVENRPLLVYEGDDSVSNPTMFFLDEVMTLRMKAPLQVLPQPADMQTRPPLG